VKDFSMKAPLIAAILVTFVGTASAETPAKPLASNESMPAQIAYRGCEYLPKGRVANLALCQSDAERSALYARMRHTIIFGVAY
jgi:hypothetical protein